MKTIVSFFLLVFSLNINLAAQSSKLYSINNDNETHDTIKVLDLLNKGQQIFSISMDSALVFFNMSLELSENAIAEKPTSQQTSRTLELLKARSLRSIGNVYNYKGIFERAIEYYFESLKIAERLGDKVGMSSCYNNIGMVNNSLRNFDIAIEYHNKSLKIKEELGDKRGIANSLNNIGLIHRNQDNNEAAIECYEKSFEIYKEIDDKRGMSASYNNIGIIRTVQRNYDLAIEYYLKSTKLKEEFDDKKGIALVYGNIAISYINIADSVARTSDDERNYLLKAINYGIKSLEIAREVKALPTISNAASTLKDTYRRLGKLDKALEYSEVFIAAKDSMFSQDKTKVLAEMQTKYETEKKQQEIEKQQLIIEKSEIDYSRQRIKLNFFVLGSVLLGLLVLVVFLAYRQKNTSNLIISEKNAMLEQAFEENKSTTEALSFQNTKLKEQNEEIIAQREILQKAQKQLVQSEKMASIGVLTAGIAHEINNPINFVYAGVNVLRRDFNDILSVINEITAISTSDKPIEDARNHIIGLKEKSEFDESCTTIQQTLDDIQIGAKRIAEIVEGLRNYTRIEKDEWIEVDPRKIIDEVLILLKNNYANRINIIKEYKNLNALLHCKASRLNQAFMNIISNAIDAIDDKGSITIAAHQESSFLVVSVKDDGKGINEDVITKIFDPFYTTKQVGKGIGLGLSITYGIIQEHNGSIKVNSKIGIGTEFIITLPLIRE